LSEEEKTKKIFREIVKIVSYLHSRGILHRDIKLENIMMCVNKRPQSHSSNAENLNITLKSNKKSVGQ
jgi:serine/threonine protein kinase